MGARDVGELGGPAAEEELLRRLWCKKAVKKKKKARVDRGQGILRRGWEMREVRKKGGVQGTLIW